MKRDDLLASIKSAGYHNDMRSFMRLYVENKISYEIALKAFSGGQNAKKKGMPCLCSACKGK